MTHLNYLDDNRRNRRGAIAFAVSVAVMLAVGAVMFLSGCAQKQGATIQQTPPSLVTLTTDAVAATDAAEQAITLGLQLQVNGKYVITDAEYVAKIRPIILKIRDAEKTMEAEAASNPTGWKEAKDIVDSLSAQIAPYVSASNAAQASAGK